MLTGYLPKFTLPSRVTDDRRGDGVAMICDGVSMLIDGFEGGEPTNGLKSWLANKGISDIDIAVLTHGHYDHYHGLQLIEEDERFHIKVLYCYDPETLRHGVDNTANGRAVKSDIANMYNFIRTMQSHGTKVIFINHGGTIKCGGINWKIYRKQPTSFTHLDGGEAYAFLNDGSLVLYSPEVRCIFGGDGPNALKDAIAYFNDKVVFYDVSHHGNACSESNAIALKKAGCILAWQSCIERNGVGSTNWTAYGSRRVKQQGITVWQQNMDVTFTAGGGKITFRQGSNVITADVPYQGATKEGWKQGIKGWWYQYADGTWAIGWAWLKWSKGENWFYFDYEGWMVTGWQYLKWSQGKSWFYFDKKTGAMLTGWQTLPWGDNKIDEFYLDSTNGNVLYGWQWLEKNGKASWFYLDDKNGNMHKGWVFVDKYWYFLDDNDGRMHTGWLNRQGLFYLEPVSGKNQGHAYRNQTAVIDGKTWSFDDNCYAHEIKTTGGNITSVSGKLNDISTSRKQFVIDIANYVRKYAPQYGINVYSPIIAQAIHESGWGESKLSAKYHNYFGLKCGTKWTGKSVNMKTQEEYSAGTLTTISANFRAYDSMEEGVKGYFDFIQLPRYSNLKGITSPRKYLETIIADGYATGKSYVDHVMNLINLYSLTQFDGVVAPATPSKTTTNANPVDMMIQIMDAELGYHEGANNHTKYGDEMHKIQPSNMDANAAWCDCWFDWCVLQLCKAFGYDADMAREVLCGDFDDYTYSSVNLYKRQGRWFASPQKGDQIFFGGAGHTGGVVDVKNGEVYTDEGNKSDQVMRCKYKIGDSRIIGYGRPKYELLSGGLTAENMPLIKKGATGFAVVELQKRLNAASYNGKTILTVDGDFGNKTYNALKAYQKDRGLEVDGECGKNSWKSLFNEV